VSIAGEALKQLRRRPCTIRYPVEKAKVPNGFRGMPVWDMQKCILCVLCQNACPPGAIRLIGKGPDAEIEYLLDRCIFCEECAEVCPKRAIAMSHRFELAGFDRSKMAFRFSKDRQVQGQHDAPKTSDSTGKG